MAKWEPMTIRVAAACNIRCMASGELVDRLTNIAIYHRGDTGVLGPQKRIRPVDNVGEEQPADEKEQREIAHSQVPRTGHEDEHSSKKCRQCKHYSHAEEIWMVNGLEACDSVYRATCRRVAPSPILFHKPYYPAMATGYSTFVQVCWNWGLGGNDAARSLVATRPDSDKERYEQGQRSAPLSSVPCPSR